MEQVILVDEQDNEIGTMEKMEAHKKGLLHRAFSVLIYNSNGELLLQKRAQSKYHSGGLWTNTCCSHPHPEESIFQAAQRKLNQEMGIALQTKFVFKFTYKTSLDNNLTEHEIDHVLIGHYDGQPKINPSEAEDWKFENPETVKGDMMINPERYTYWFKKILNHPKMTGLPA